MDDKKLYSLWKKYIDKPIYRVIPAVQKKEVLKNGFNPKKDPYEKINPKIKKLFNIVNKLEKKGFIYYQEWKNGTVKGSKISKITLRSIRGKYIDFVVKKQKINRFKKMWNGGCLVTYTFKLSEFLLKHSSKLNSKEKVLVKFLNNWAKKRHSKDYSTLYINGSNKIFEKALFYNYSPDFKRYWKSPYGSFENFKKTIKKHGINRYLPFFNEEKIVYLRVKEKISPKHITFMD